MVGALALAGVPLLSGFYSKDAILMQAWLHQPPLFYLGVAVAALTAFYMMRCVLVAFFGEARTDAAREAPRAKLAMVVPLMILTVFSIGLGQPWLGLDRHTDGMNNWDKHARIQFDRESKANLQDSNATDQDTAGAFGKTRDRAHSAAMMGGTLAAALGLLLGLLGVDALLAVVANQAQPHGQVVVVGHCNPPFAGLDGLVTVQA